MLTHNKNSKTSLNLSGSHLFDITVAGVICCRSNAKKNNIEYKLVCPSGEQYLLLATREWRNVISNLLWQKVKLVGVVRIEDNKIWPKQIITNRPNSILSKLNPIINYFAAV